MTETACEFVPAHEPWQCSVHPGGYRTSLNEGMCRAAQAETVQPLTPAEIEEFDRWAESRKGKGVSLGMLWALRLRATLDAARASSLDLATLREAAQRVVDYAKAHEPDNRQDFERLEAALATPAASSEAAASPGDGEIDPETDALLARYFDARRGAILNVVAHKASPPEYPGLALVPVSDIERLERFLDLPRTREALAAAPRGDEGLDPIRLKEAMLRAGPIGGVHPIDFQQAFAVVSLSQQQLAMEFAESLAREYAALAAEETP